MRASGILMSKILLPLLTALFIVGCDRTAEAPPPVKPSVQVSTVQMEAVTPREEFVGRTSASRDISIKAKVRGTLLDRHFEAAVPVPIPLFRVGKAALVEPVDQRSFGGIDPGADFLV